MSTANLAAATKPTLNKRFRSPQTVIARFIAKRTAGSAVFWAAVFGVFVASKSIGFVKAYPTAHEQAAVAATFLNNIGIEALLGKPHHVATVAGFTVWSTLCVMSMIGGIWALMLATRNFRGEEDAGRWELLLAGQTTARRAAANTLVGLGAAIAVLYVVSAITFAIVGRVHGIGFGTGAALFFALAAICGAAQFIAVGALASQLMPTRARAAGLSAAIFGACFLARAMADTTSVHWLINVTPLGWIENLQPLTDTQPIWLLPIGGLIFVLSALTIFLAGRRDLGESIFADTDSAKTRTGLLRSPLTAALRLTGPTSLSWLVGIGIAAFFYGLLTKSAAQALNQTLSAEHIINQLAHVSQSLGATTFLGIVFLLQITMIMAYAASAVGRMREDEAEGYLDNLLVRPVSRLRWLLGRVFLAVVVIVVAGLLTTLGTWAGEINQQTGVSFHTLLLAGINTLAPALLILGIGVFALGITPRLTTVIAYGVIAWTFLIEMVSSGLNLSHWVLDTSILYHVALAPAANPKWGSDAVLAGIGLALGVIGALVFNYRDLEPE
ncbi:MAG TPA: ABC transporter permease subunit [Candidatus Saccharimonadales bacterium]|nr:ABC transporter permease subunit [Candidatus Saccharimonadales bacterium]